MVNENWTDIHENFNEYYWQRWEENGFTYEEVKEWIVAGGLIPQEYWLAKELKETNYTSQQFADKFESQRDVQEWVDYFYPHEQKTTISKLNIKTRNLTDTLNVTDFPNLEELDCSYNKLTNLIITNCPNLQKINCRGNNLTTKNIKKNWW
jgi:hypothetical protein